MCRGKSEAQRRGGRLKVSGGTLKRICGLLVKGDPDIAEIVQFGSSIYAPEHARDLDLLVFTRRRKDYGVYLDAACEAYDELGFPYNIDVVPKEVGKPLSESLGRSVLGAYRVLYGDGGCLRRATRHLGDPTFKEARSFLRGSKEDLELARRATSEIDRDRRLRTAFDGLFHGARVASVACLSTEATRWGRVRGELPGAYREAFDEFVRVLHVRYFYEGNYPREGAEEFQRWLRKVEEYVERLESERGR